MERRYLPRLLDAWLAELVADVPGVMLVGPRSCGKTTSAQRLAATVLRLDQQSVRDAVEGDPDAVLADADPPVLVDEWQRAPASLGAAKRLIDHDARAGRFLFTGSAADDLTIDQWPGTGRFIRVPMWGLTRREIEGSVGGRTFIDCLLDREDGTDLAISLPRDRPDTAGYVDRALASGFPEALFRSSERTRAAWLDSYIDHLVGREVSLIADVRDPRKLRRYLRAVAASTAGIPAINSLLDAAEINRSTAERYDHLLERLYVTEQVPPWSSNRLTRVTNRPKRYVCEPAIAATLLGADRRTILRDGDLLGRIIDTFVAAQIRPELNLGRKPAAMYHLRQDGGRREVDLVIERTDSLLAAIEVKAATSVTPHDARHLIWLRDQLPPSTFRTGIVFYTGTHLRTLAEKIWAVPICALWA